MSKIDVIKSSVEKYLENKQLFERFLYAIRDFFLINSILNNEKNPIIHSVKYRLKDPDHLKDKLNRKWDETNPITPENIFQRITDLAGVRVLHLYQDQFSKIHAQIIEHIDSGEWVLAEEPKAYTWDPESHMFFDRLGIKCYQKESYYTSIHYLIKPNSSSVVTCEIQVRTLFEEIWGEIDHIINYPHEIDNMACKEQIRVLSKLISTGTRLADSIFRCYDNHLEITNNRRRRK